MKKLKNLLIIFLMIICIDNVFATSPYIKVYDYAQVLTNKEESKLNKSAELYTANYNMDMVIVLVKYHGKENTLEYSEEFYNTKGFGIGDNKNGIMCVVDFSNENIEISKYGDAKNIYNEEYTKKILESINKKEDKGYYKMLDTFIDKSSDYAKKSSNENSISYEMVKLLRLILVSFIISIIFILCLLIKRQIKTKKVTLKNYLVKDSFVINKKTENFITTTTISKNIKN